MKYNTVRIINNNNKLKCVIEHHDDNRVTRKTRPHPWGFYHYPTTMSEEQAINKLIDTLIEERCKNIKRMSHEITKLNQLRNNHE